MKYKEAVIIATKAHEGQLRRNGAPAISHPIAVADEFKDESYKIVAVLHDTIEDTDLTLFDLQTIHNLSPKLCSTLSLLTRQPDQEYADYIINIKKDKMAREIKIKDILDNLSGDPYKCTKSKYLLSLYILTDGMEY